MGAQDTNVKMNDEQKLAAINQIYAQARARFPGVPEITASEVLRRRQGGEKFVLVDVRSPEERATSMIRDAITTEQLEADPDIAKDKVVVCYCMIGGRSGMYTQGLCERGVNAVNMPGAVLAWSHAGGEFVDSNGPTKRVNTHSADLDFLAQGYQAVY